MTTRNASALTGYAFEPVQMLVTTAVVHGQLCGQV